MRFEEFKDMLKSGDLEQIRPHLAFEMMPADSPKTERYNDCPYVKKMSMKTDNYNKSVREEQKRRYADQGEDISEVELEETSDPVTEDM